MTLERVAILSLSLMLAASTVSSFLARRALTARARGAEHARDNCMAEYTKWAEEFGEALASPSPTPTLVTQSAPRPAPARRWDWSVNADGMPLRIDAAGTLQCVPVYRDKAGNLVPWPTPVSR